MGHSAEAEALYRQALVVTEHTVGDSHPRLVETLTRYAGLLDELRPGPEAAEVRARAASIASHMTLAAT
jgi:hypothetical protein